MIIPQISYFDLVNLYHEAKFYKTEYPMYGYEIEKEKFVKITDTKFERMKSGGIIPFKASMLLYVNRKKYWKEVVLWLNRKRDWELLWLRLLP